MDAWDFNRSTDLASIRTLTRRWTCTVGWQQNLASHNFVNSNGWPIRAR